MFTIKVLFYISIYTTPCFANLELPLLIIYSFPYALLFCISKSPIIITCQSSAKVSLRQPAYVSSSEPHKDQSQSLSLSQGPKIFTTQKSGFGSRHVHDRAPFSLWDHEFATIGEPFNHELDWMSATYRPKAIYVCLPDINIRKDLPPTEIPLTVGGALIRFVPEDMFLPNVPDGSLGSFPNSEGDDLLSSPLPIFSIPSH